MPRIFTAIVYWEEDVYVAECPEVGTASQGETIEEAIANLKEATELYLEEFSLPQTSPRLLTTFVDGNLNSYRRKAHGRKTNF